MTRRLTLATIACVIGLIALAIGGGIVQDYHHVVQGEVLLIVGGLLFGIGLSFIVY